MRISFFELEGWEKERIQAALPGHELVLSGEKIDAFTSPLPETYAETEVLSVFVNSRLTREVLALFPKLQMVATRSTGFDHIDLDYCRERGIAVAYVPGYGDNTVAEFTFGLILNLTRRIYWSIDQLRETGSFSLRGLRGYDLKGKALGVVGTGRIGREMIRIAKGFEMSVLATDPHPDADYAAAQGFGYVPLEELLRVADIVSIHCPYNEATHHLVNQANIGSMKPGAFLVNTARGAIVETEALVKALSTGAIAGAALDVLEEEGETKDELHLLAAHPKEHDLKTILANHILMKMPNVLVTPHNAFNSNEALERILEVTLENVSAFLAGTPPHLASQ